MVITRGAAKKAAASQQSIPPEIMEIIQYLTNIDTVVFKYQQIGDPDLEQWEKVEIGKQLYTESRQNFLVRFGAFFEERHLLSYQRLVLPRNGGRYMNLYYDEFKPMIDYFLHKLKTSKRDIRNRRFNAMQNLISEGDYFSESEMIKRAPELYQELVGQYLTIEEKRERDSYDVKNTTLSGILMHTMITQKQVEDALKKADKNKVEESDLSEESNQSQNSKETASVHSDPEEEVPVSFRQQWGSFDNVKVSCSTSKVGKKESKIEQKSPGQHGPLISPGERDLLWKEFVETMYEQFLEGKDEEFDYTKVDNNPDLDYFQQVDLDHHYSYFEAHDEPDDNIQSSEENVSEDELDIYMRNLE